MSRRTERVASLIRTILAESIQSRLNDPRIPPITSITRVEVSADFEVAHVYVSVLANAARRELCIKALHSSAGHLRWLLGQELTLRKTPALDFRLDESLRRGLETVEIIDRAMAEFADAATVPAEAPPEPDGAAPESERLAEPDAAPQEDA